MKPPFARYHKNGITLVELIVVLAILALLAALLFPAVQQARESARRMRCQSNLRQWGAAIQAYETHRGTFPPGQMAISPSSSFVPLVLPYVENGGLHYDLNFAWCDPANQKAVGSKISILICPTTAVSDRHDRTAFFAPASGDYTSIHGVALSSPAVAGWPAFKPQGIMSVQPCPAADVSDGLSNTILLVEDAGRPQLWRMGAAAWGAAKFPSWAEPDYEIEMSGSDRLTTGSGEGNGTCVLNCTNDNEVYSFHSGGAYVLFGDGSVHFIAQQIDPRTFVALITRAAHDRIDPAGL